jgi:hypothetical protein
MRLWNKGVPFPTLTYRPTRINRRSSCLIVSTQHNPGAEATRHCAQLRELQRVMAAALFRPLTPQWGMQKHWTDGSRMHDVAAEFIKPNDRLSCSNGMTAFRHLTRFTMKRSKPTNSATNSSPRPPRQISTPCTFRRLAKVPLERSNVKTALGTVECAMAPASPVLVRGQEESAISGVGLRLALCRSIIAAHGGTIRAEPAQPALQVAFDFKVATPVAQLQAEGNLAEDCRHRPVPYLNNVLEQDHRAIAVSPVNPQRRQDQKLKKLELRAWPVRHRPDCTASAAADHQRRRYLPSVYNRWFATALSR